MAKKYSKAAGKYYFAVHSSFQTITIHRDEKADAVMQFLNYQKVGKKVEWLGRWNGKSYEDTGTPTEMMA